MRDTHSTHDKNNGPFVLGMFLKDSGSDYDFVDENSYLVYSNFLRFLQMKHDGNLFFGPMANNLAGVPDLAH